MDTGFHVIIGRGDRAIFWSDIRCNSASLKEDFPRIFVLSSNKNGFMKDFGSWQKEVWRWDIPMRRPLFDWETKVWESFRSVLDKIKIRRWTSDKIAWSMCKLGIFSVSSFQKCLENSPHSDLAWDNFVWGGFCPPKVQVFAWQV